MANTVAYNNSTNPVGSIKKGVVSINIDNSLITSGLTWRNGIEFTNQYIIYSDTYTQGIDTQQNAKPCAWSCNYNDTALLNLINSLPPLIGQPKYNTLSDAIAWLEGQNKYFLVNQNYPEIVTSGCVLNMDAGMSGSYPNAGTTWYDLTSQGSNGSILNGTTWVNSSISSYFSFDGTDDRINVGSNTIYRLKDNMSFNFTFNLSDTSGETLVTRGEQTNKGFYWIMIYGALPYFQYQNTSGTIIGVQPGYTFSTGKWYNMSIVVDKPNLYFYVNSQLINTTDISALGTAAFDSDLYVGSYNTWTNNWQFNGGINLSQIYNRSLSQSEVSQNYYRGKLVTSGLTLALDAGNLVSYAGAGTTWYDMTSNGNNGTLTNGPTYSGGTVPSIVFDGTDDRIVISNVAALRPSAFTATAWVNCNVANGNQKTIFSSYYELPVAGFSFQLWNGSGSNNKVRFFVGNNNGPGAGTYQDYTGSLNVPINTWNHIAVSYDGTSTMRIYVNGVADATASWTGGCVYNTVNNQVQVGSNISTSHFPGNISNVQLYNRALTLSEIQQNFNTYRRRYGT